MPTNTYVALDKVTVGTATNSITFSSIPSTYTDLLIVANFTGSGSGNNLMMQVGNTTIDTGSNYSATGMYGNGTSALSWRQSSVSAIQATYAIGLEARNMSRISLMNYANTTTNKTIITRSDGLSGTYNATEAIVSLWRSTAAINTIKLYGLNSATISSGSTFSLYGIAATSVGAKATGGTVYSDSLYYYHVFDSTGTFTPLQSLSCDALILAGGGGGGAETGGGGGAGGLLAVTSQSVTATNYTITVGAGGAKGVQYGQNGSNGTDSVFNSNTAIKGGGGGSNQQNTSGTYGSAGGSGASTNQGNPVTANGTATSGQGYAGGDARAYSNKRSAGGGGGAGGAGTTAPDNQNGGAGGVGSTSYSTWLTATGLGVSGSIAGGGGGGGHDTSGGTATGGGGYGGYGNSGNPTIQNGANATANTGGGGGGGAAQANYPTNTLGIGGNGGSGIVIVRYAK